MRYPIALSNLNVFKKQHPTFSGRDAISFCYDYLCKIVPQKLPATKLKPPLCSWASPSFVKLEGIKRTHPLLSMKLYKKYSSINLQRCLFETDKIPVTFYQKKKYFAYMKEREYFSLEYICNEVQVGSLLDSHISWKISTIYEKFGKQSRSILVSAQFQGVPYK